MQAVNISDRLVNFHEVEAPEDIDRHLVNDYSVFSTALWFLQYWSRLIRGTFRQVLQLTFIERVSVTITSSIYIYIICNNV